MQASTRWLTLAVTGAALIQGCDRKSEVQETTAVEDTTAAEATQEEPAAAVVAAAVTVEDAGADGGAAVVGVIVTSIATKGNPTVVNSIAQARCEQEQKCGDIGAGQEYASMDACLKKVATDWRDELNAYECPGGVEQGELVECMNAIRDEQCESVFDTLGRIIECRSGDICDAVP